MDAAPAAGDGGMRAWHAAGAPPLPCSVQSSHLHACAPAVDRCDPAHWRAVLAAMGLSEEQESQLILLLQSYLQQVRSGGGGQGLGPDGPAPPQRSQCLSLRGSCRVSRPACLPVGVGRRLQLLTCSPCRLLCNPCRGSRLCSARAR